jgi:hypothetical protein
MVNPMSGQQAILALHLADKTSCAAVVVSESIDGSFKQFSYDRLDSWITCQ